MKPTAKVHYARSADHKAACGCEAKLRRCPWYVRSTGDVNKVTCGNCLRVKAVRGAKPC